MLLFFFVFLVTSFLHILDHAKVMNLLLKWCLSFYNGFDFSICFKKLNIKLLIECAWNQTKQIFSLNKQHIHSFKSFSKHNFTK
jgi:hypothetical protein